MTAFPRRRRAALAALAGTLLLVAPVLGAPPAPSAAQPGTAGYQPDGFGAAKFGMSLGEVWGMYKEARLLPERKSLGAAVLDGPYVERLELDNRTVEGLSKPATVELRFWKGKLWGVIIYFDKTDLEQVKAYLNRHYGPSAAKNPDLPLWRGEKVTTTATLNQGWYGYSDNELSKEATAWIQATMNGSWKHETAEEKAERSARMAALTPRADAQVAPPTPAPPDPSTHSGH